MTAEETTLTESLVEESKSLITVDEDIVSKDINSEPIEILEDNTPEFGAHNQ